MKKTMKNTGKYTAGYFLPPENAFNWTKKDRVEKAPIWCSVDLRDGNQALINPMSLEQKLEFFSFLVKIGFKEIEVGFPAASDTEYEFCRALIEKNLIPDDVTIQVLTQSREHIIKKTFEALRGAKSAVVHLYNSTSAAQREQVFKKSREDIIALAVSGAEMLNRFSREYEGNFRFEYSPESFTGTEIDFALDICNAVLKVWEEEQNVIINLPVTVQLSMPHVYASQIEYMCGHLLNRRKIIVSLHPHNDRGCAVADTEMGLLAGADRVEGTLFGNGERTGNADIITLALNMYSQGVDPGLDLSDIPLITDVYEKMTGMSVHQRHPYCGELVFAAFSGSHQDAIAKGMAWREEKQPRYWNVPYLPIDPTDIGRQYDGDVIRINSQSGKGGIGYILKSLGVDLPAKMRESVGYAIKGVSDKLHKELSPDEVYNAFMEQFVNVKGKIELVSTRYTMENDNVDVEVTFKYRKREHTVMGSGNGHLDAVNNALNRALGIKFNITDYHQDTMSVGSNAKAISYIEITDDNGKSSWGAGLRTDITKSAVNALASALNRSDRFSE